MRKSKIELTTAMRGGPNPGKHGGGEEDPEPRRGRKPGSKEWRYEHIARLLVGMRAKADAEGWSAEEADARTVEIIAFALRAAPLAPHFHEAPRDARKRCAPSRAAMLKAIRRSLNYCPLTPRVSKALHDFPARITGECAFGEDMLSRTTTRSTTRPTVDLAALPQRVDRRTAAEIVSRTYFPVTHRVVEGWKLPAVRIAGKAMHETRAVLAEAGRRLDAAKREAALKRQTREGDAA